MIQNNNELISIRYQDSFNKMILHIEAFEEHLINPNYDYSEYQFSVEFQNLVIETCEKNALNDKLLSKSIRWLDSRFKKYKVENWFIFGSILLYPRKALDTDVAILFNSLNDKTMDSIQSLKMDYKLKFKKDLHLAIFSESELADFEIFRDKNKIRRNG